MMKSIIITLINDIIMKTYNKCKINVISDLTKNASNMAFSSWKEGMGKGGVEEAFRESPEPAFVGWPTTYFLPLGLAPMERPPNLAMMLPILLVF